MKDTGQINIPEKREEHSNQTISQAQIQEQKQKMKEQKRTKNKK